MHYCTISPWRIHSTKGQIIEKTIKVRREGSKAPFPTCDHGGHK